MSKLVNIKLKSAGGRVTLFSIKDNFGNVLREEVTKKELASGIAIEVNSNVNVITVTSIGKKCPVIVKHIPVTTITRPDLAALQFEVKNTASLWVHLKSPNLYNTYYGVKEPYIIEYPFAYQFNDEILQNVKDYTKAYKYLSVNTLGTFDPNNKIEVDNKYFTKAILYNGQQSTGLLQLEAKPSNNMKAYLAYPKFKKDSKVITFTKIDNFYQYNTFWSVVKDKQQPLFNLSCESMSIDKEINQSNMDYSHRSFKKEPLRAKDLKVRHIYDGDNNINLVSQFITAPSQISYR
jgi:hypothetical protein